LISAKILDIDVYPLEKEIKNLSEIKDYSERRRGWKQ